jgi:N-acetylmuramoyl-L-alanine amidase
MWVYRKYFFLFLVLLLSAPATNAKQIRVNSVIYTSEATQSKIVLTVPDSPKYSVFMLDNPSRLVIDVKNAQAGRALAQPSPSHPLFSHIRAGAKNNEDLRIVVDLKQTVTAKSHKLATNYSDNRHLTIDFLNRNSPTIAVKAIKRGEKPAKASIVEEPIEKTAKTVHSTNKNKGNKNHFIVAIDAGHGGDDPGAKGPNGSQEKQVTLAISKKLQALINGQPGMKAKLVRKGDYYVGLRERMKIARQANADLFISIHADAVNNPDVRGASVYTLSRNGASSEAARWLANSENAKEKMGGVNLDDKDDMLATVLLDLSQTATQQASLNIADKVLKNFKNIGDLHCHNVQKAGFVVLKSPDIPSILVETAYISNPTDELNLLSNRYQTKMANAIFKGILNYVEQMGPSEINRMAKLE